LRSTLNSNMHRAKYLLFVFFLIHYCSFGQILDDSTKQVYGPKSTEYILEADVFKNKKIKYNPDTLMNQFFKTDPLMKSGWMFQDLGNNGTASKPILYQPRENIYTETGFLAYDLYSPKVRDFKYFNTKSPYTNMAYVQGFKGFSNLNFTHAQNVNKQLNFTLDINRINSSKQFSTTRSEDKLIDHWNYSLSSNFVSKNEKYTFLGVFYHLNHLQNEQGGINAPDSVLLNEKYIDSDYNLSYQARMAGVTSSERWNNLHIYHQYKLANGFQAFHVFDMERKKHFYNDFQFGLNYSNGFYPDSLVTNDTLRQNIRYRAFGNKFGFKGRFKGFDYQAYVLHRIYDLHSNHGDLFRKKLTNEVFAGAQAAYYLNDSTKYLLAEAEFSQKAYFKINGELHYDNLIIGLQSGRFPVGLIYNNFYSLSGLEWSNNFDAPANLHLSGAYDLKFYQFNVKPSIKYSVLKNHLYFDQDGLPQINKAGINLTDLALEIGYSGKVFSFVNSAFLNIKINDGKNVIRRPVFMNNTTIMFKILYAKVLRIQTGLDIYYKSAYKADAYMPLTQQFHLQDKYEVWGNVVVDPFVAFNIKRVRLALKFGNVTQGLGKNGYYTTPYYLGMGRSFYLKIEWPLFD
jgi:hypothetical protein